MSDQPTTAPAAAEEKPVPQVLKKFVHETYIEQEGIKPGEIPDDLKRRMTKLSEKKTEYVRKPTNPLYQSINKEDAMIADDLIDWWEDKNIPEPKPEEPGAQQASTSSTSGATSSSTNPAPASTSGESEFQKIMKKYGNIHHSDLKRLMNKKNLSTVEEFEGMKLKRTTLTSRYYPVKAIPSTT